MKSPVRIALFGLLIVALVLVAVRVLGPKRAPEAVVTPTGESAAEPARGDDTPALAEPSEPPEPVSSAPATRPAPPLPGVVDAGVPFDPERASEEAVMEHARAALSQSPEKTLRLIRTADQRFGIESEGRRVLEIDALVRLQRIGESMGKAERFYQYYPQSNERRRIEVLTGAHPRPWGPNSR